jgi:hypothetical protein
MAVGLSIKFTADSLCVQLNWTQQRQWLFTIANMNSFFNLERFEATN